jgi:hypothetical protein
MASKGTVGLSAAVLTGLRPSPTSHGVQVVDDLVAGVVDAHQYLASDASPEPAGTTRYDVSPERSGLFEDLFHCQPDRGGEVLLVGTH